jgi:hypothetical protein
LSSLPVRAAAVGDLGDDRPSTAVVVRNFSGDEIIVCRHGGEGVQDLRPGRPLEPAGQKEVTSLALGDVTGDGALELVVAGDDPPGLSVYVDPRGAPSAPRIIPLDLAPTVLVLEDLDGNVLQEIAAGSGIGNERNSLQVVSLDDAGQVSRSVTVSPGEGALVLAAGRFGPESAMRLAAASLRTDSVKLFLFDGKDLLVERELPAVSPAALAAGSLDADDRSDLVVAGNFSSKIAVHLQGVGSLGNEPSYDLSLPAGVRPRLVVSGDLNADRLADLIAVGTSQQGKVTGTLFVQARSGSLSLREPDVLFSARNVVSVAIGDLEADGRNDLLILDAEDGGNLKIHGQTILGLLSLVPTAVIHLEDVPVPTGTTLELVAVGDLDGDGRNDIAAANNAAGKVKVFGSDVKEMLDLVGAPGPRGVAVEDLTGDGRNDLVSAGTDAVTLQVQEGNGVFVPRDVPVNGQPLDLSTADLDGDGMSDLALLYSSKSLWTYLQRGGKLAPGPQLAFSEDATSFSIGDLDGDGANDMVIVHRSGALVFHQRNGAFAADPDRRLTAGGSTRAVGAGDLNGDGRTDVVIGTNSPTRIAVYYQDGAGELGVASADPGTRQPSEAFGTVLLVSGIALGDLNGDGKDDIAALFGGSAVYLAR